MDCERLKVSTCGREYACVRLFEICIGYLCVYVCGWARALPHVRPHGTVGSDRIGPADDGGVICGMELYTVGVVAWS